MKKEMKCPLCEKILYSEIGKGCRMCRMVIEVELEFCSEICEDEYSEIKQNERRFKENE